MRIAVSLLALVFAVAAMSPCAFARADQLGRRDAGAAKVETGHSHAQNAPDKLAHPCHDAARVSLNAPCPCGCGERAPGPTLGALGVALLLVPSALPQSTRARGVFLSDAHLALAPPLGIEKVPRSA